MAITTDKVIIDENKRLLSLDSIHGIEPSDALELALIRSNFSEYYKIDYQTKAIIYTRFNDMPYEIYHDGVKDIISAALDSLRPSVFFETLFELGILQHLLPNVYQLTTLKEGSKHHLEASVFEHTLMMMRLFETNYRQTYHGCQNEIIMAILLHDIAKPYCYRLYGSSAGHDSKELIVQHLDDYLRPFATPMVMFLVINHIRVYRTHEMSSRKIASFLEQFTSPHQLDQLITLALCDAYGRFNSGVENDIEDALLYSALFAIQSFNPDELISAYESQHGVLPEGEALYTILHQENIKIVDNLISTLR